MEEKDPAQQNSYDCGMYVKYNTEALCQNASLDNSQNHYCSYSILHTSQRREKNGKIPLPDLLKMSCWNISDIWSLFPSAVPMCWMAAISVPEGRCLGEECLDALFLLWKNVVLCIILVENVTLALTSEQLYLVNMSSKYAPKLTNSLFGGPFIHIGLFQRKRLISKTNREYVKSRSKKKNHTATKTYLLTAHIFQEINWLEADQDLT